MGGTTTATKQWIGQWVFGWHKVNWHTDKCVVHKIPDAAGVEASGKNIQEVLLVKMTWKKLSTQYNNNNKK